MKNGTALFLRHAILHVLMSGIEVGEVAEFLEDLAKTAPAFNLAMRNTKAFFNWSAGGKWNAPHRRLRMRCTWSNYYSSMDTQEASHF